MYTLCKYIFFLNSGILQRERINPLYIYSLTHIFQRHVGFLFLKKNKLVAFEKRDSFLESYNIRSCARNKENTGFVITLVFVKTRYSQNLYYTSKYRMHMFLFITKHFHWLDRNTWLTLGNMYLTSDLMRTILYYIATTVNKSKHAHVCGVTKQSPVESGRVWWSNVSLYPCFVVFLYWKKKCYCII